MSFLNSVVNAEIIGNILKGKIRIKLKKKEIDGDEITY